jgi:hypothetical protein
VPFATLIRASRSASRSAHAFGVCAKGTRALTPFGRRLPPTGGGVVEKNAAPPKPKSLPKIACEIRFRKPLSEE